MEDTTLGDLVSTFMHAHVQRMQYCYRIRHHHQLPQPPWKGGYTAAYAEDLVDTLSTFRQSFVGQIRAVQGFTISTTAISNQVIIRALVEIEAWLVTVDLRRAHSLPETSQYFKDNILASLVDQAESNM